MWGESGGLLLIVLGMLSVGLSSDVRSSFLSRDIRASYK